MAHSDVDTNFVEGGTLPQHTHFHTVDTTQLDARDIRVFEAPRGRRVTKITNCCQEAINTMRYSMADDACEQGKGGGADGGIALKHITTVVASTAASPWKGCTEALTADMLSKADKDKLRSKECSLEEALSLLHTDTTDGLATEEANRRAESFGPNSLKEKKQNPILVFLGFMWNPLSWVMELAALVALLVGAAGDGPPDWQDFIGIVILLLVNSTIGFVEETAAAKAVAALQAGLAPTARVKRGGVLAEVPAATLVPGDVVAVKLGDVLPADIRALPPPGSGAPHSPSAAAAAGTVGMCNHL